MHCEGLQVDVFTRSQVEMQISDLEKVGIGSVLLKRRLLT